MYISLNIVKDKSIGTLSKRIVASFFTTVSQIMHNTVNKKLLQSLNCHVKLFLTYLCKLEVIINKQKRTPKEYPTSNFSGLMNLKTYMRVYDPL